LALVGMAAQRTVELLQNIDIEIETALRNANLRLGIFTSLSISGGIILVRKIFKFIGESEYTRLQNERKVLRAVIMTEKKIKKNLPKAFTMNLDLCFRQ
jgi:hypothetical protein